MSDIKDLPETIKSYEVKQEEPKDAMQLVKDATEKYVLDIEWGSRMSLSDLIDKVVYTTGQKYSVVQGLVNLYVHNGYFPNVRVERGRSGGVYRGIKERSIDNRPRCSECTQVIPKHLLEKLNAAKQSA
jgi:hypothetical protein